MTGNGYTDRFLTADETRDIADALKTPGDRTPVLAEVIWAMVASAEFRFNH